MSTAIPTAFSTEQYSDIYPDSRGHFGPYGGRYVPETLMSALGELEELHRETADNEAFHSKFTRLLHTYVGRPTPISHAKRLSEKLGGAQIYLKREDLAHTGAHKINNALGQALMAKDLMGKTRIVAETGAGQHGVATATACALLDMECVVYMGTVDMARQSPNVFRMRLMGADVREVSSGSQTLKDAINDAIRDWVTNVGTTHYLLGSALGPHPYPLLVRDLQSVIGKESRVQMLDPEKGPGRLPDVLMACVGGGSNSLGLFHPFLMDPEIRMIGVEAGGQGIESGLHAARFADKKRGRLGVLHGTKSFVLQDDDGQIALTHSVSAGLDYASVSPEHALLRDRHRVEYVYCTDDKALAGFKALCELEGIVPALESAHAVGYALQLVPTLSKEDVVLLNLSGRGDKDLDVAMKELA